MLTGRTGPWWKTRPKSGPLVGQEARLNLCRTPCLSLDRLRTNGGKRRKTLPLGKALDFDKVVEEECTDTPQTH